jgi:hypothetical protein
MKTITTTVYDYAELSPVAKEKASAELLAFVEGYNMASSGLETPFNIFAIWQKGAK